MAIRPTSPVILLPAYCVFDPDASTGDPSRVFSRGMIHQRCCGHMAFAGRGCLATDARDVRPPVGALVEDGAVGLVLVREIERLVGAQLERDAGDQKSAQRVLAGDDGGVGVALAPVLGELAKAERRVDPLL